MVSEPSQTVTMTVGPARPRLVTADQVREHIGSNSTDTDELLTRLIDDADQAVVSRYGPHSIDGPVTEVHPGGSVRLFPRRSRDSQGDVETDGERNPPCSPDDYRTWYGGRMLERLSNGAHPRADWGERVELDIHAGRHRPTAQDGHHTPGPVGAPILRAKVRECGSVQRPEPRLHPGAGGHP